MTDGGRPDIFVDTSAFFAVYNANDADHLRMAPIFAAALSSGRLATTNVVAAETHALLLTKVGRHVAHGVLLGMYESKLSVVRVGEDDERLARALLARYDDKDFSYADAMSFVVMERLSIRTALTFDRHFAQYDLDVLTANMHS